MKKKLLIHTFSLFVTSPFLLAQSFTDLQNGFPSLIGASVAWADYDGDKDVDFALIGFSSFQAELGRIYRNDGSGAFTVIKDLEFPVSSGAVTWGDFDHDGDPDLLVNGQGGLFSPAAVATVYRNDGNENFTPLSNLIPGVIGISRWIDYDGDGWQDIIMAGIGNSFLEDSIRLFHNDTTGGFIEVQINLPGYHATDISIVDFDVDGDMDFFLVGGTLSPSTFPVTRLIRNDGNAQFNQVPFPFINLSTGTTAWADYDHDGDPDVLYDGLDSTLVFAMTLMYRNDGLDQFTLIDANLPGSGEPGSVDWADVDGDGDLDILLGGPTTLLRNDGNNVYTDITPVDFQQGIPCSFADIDSDGDKDILIISSSGGESASSIHRNESVTANQQFLVPGHTWIYAYNVYDFLPDPLVDQTIETITVGNDTIINSLTYYELIITKPQPCGVFDTLEYLREVGGKIFRLSHDHSREFLMIDFDETVSYPLLYEKWGEVDTAIAIIDSFGIETIMDGSQVEVQYLHIINNQSYSDDTEYKVYKGIGFVQYGLLFPDLGTGLCDVMEGIQLRCFTDGSDTLHFTEFGCYEITLGSATYDLAFNEIMLSPNPVSEEIILPDNFLVEQCFSIQGQSVPFFQSGNKLDVHDWQPGMYLLKLSNRYTQEAGISRILKH